MSSCLRNRIVQGGTGNVHFRRFSLSAIFKKNTGLWLKKATDTVIYDPSRAALLQATITMSLQSKALHNKLKHVMETLLRFAFVWTSTQFQFCKRRNKKTKRKTSHIFSFHTWFVSNVSKNVLRWSCSGKKTWPHVYTGVYGDNSELCRKEKEAFRALCTRESAILKYPRQSIGPSLDMFPPVRIPVPRRAAHTGHCLVMGR